jgi:hypothetical protein
VPDTDPAALVAAIRDRNEAYIKSMAFTEATVREMPSGDLRKALAAVEAVLQRHQPKPRTTVHPCPEHSIWAPLAEIIGPDTRRNCPDCRYAESIACAACDPVCPDDNVWPCKDVQAISRALLGEDGNG